MNNDKNIFNEDFEKTDFTDLVKKLHKIEQHITTEEFDQKVLAKTDEIKPKPSMWKSFIWKLSGYADSVYDVYLAIKIRRFLIYAVPLLLVGIIFYFSTKEPEQEILFLEMDRSTDRVIILDSSQKAKDSIQKVYRKSLLDEINLNQRAFRKDEIDRYKLDKVLERDEFRNELNAKNERDSLTRNDTIRSILKHYNKQQLPQLKDLN